MVATQRPPQLTLGGPAPGGCRAAPAGDRGARARASTNDVAIASVASSARGRAAVAHVARPPSRSYQPPDPLRGEVGVGDDLRPESPAPGGRPGSSAALAWRSRISVFSAGSRSLASTSTPRRAGKRSAPRSRCSRRSAGVQGCRPGGPDQPVAVVERAQQPLHSRAQRSAASARYSVEPNASSAMNTCRAGGRTPASRSSGLVHSWASHPWSSWPARASARSPSCPSPAAP